MAVLSGLFMHSKKCVLGMGTEATFCIQPMDIVFVVVIFLLLVPQVLVVSRGCLVVLRAEKGEVLMVWAFNMLEWMAL